MIHRQTKNPILRWWGNACAFLGNFFYGQAEKYGDLYDMGDMLTYLEELDNTIAWDPEAD